MKRVTGLVESRNDNLLAEMQMFENVKLRNYLKVQPNLCNIISFKENGKCNNIIKEKNLLYIY